MYRSSSVRDVPSSIRVTVGQNLFFLKLGRGYAAWSFVYGLFHSFSGRVMSATGCGAFFSRLLSLGCLPEMMSSTSLRIWIMASQNLEERVS